VKKVRPAGTPGSTGRGKPAKANKALYKAVSKAAGLSDAARAAKRAAKREGAGGGGGGRGRGSRKDKPKVKVRGVGAGMQVGSLSSPPSRTSVQKAKKGK